MIRPFASVILALMLKGDEMRRKVRDHKDAVELLDALERSGRSLADFCHAAGVDGRSLNCWRQNLRRSRAPTVGLRLVEVTPTRPASPPALYRVVLGGVEIEVDDDFRAETLARLLAVVAGC